MHLPNPTIIYVKNPGEDPFLREDQQVACEATDRFYLPVCTLGGKSPVRAEQKCILA